MCPSRDEPVGRPCGGRKAWKELLVLVLELLVLVLELLALELLGRVRE